MGWCAIGFEKYAIRNVDDLATAFAVERNLTCSYLNYFSFQDGYSLGGTDLE